MPSFKLAATDPLGARVQVKAKNHDEAEVLGTVEEIWGYDRNVKYRTIRKLMTGDRIVSATSV